MRKLLKYWVSEVDKLLSQQRLRHAKSQSQKEEIRKANRIAEKRDNPHKPSIDEIWKDF